MSNGNPKRDERWQIQIRGLLELYKNDSSPGKIDPVIQPAAHKVGGDAEQQHKSGYADEPPLFTQPVDRSLFKEFHNQSLRWAARILPDELDTFRLRKVPLNR